MAIPSSCLVTAPSLPSDGWRRPAVSPCHGGRFAGSPRGRLTYDFGDNWRFDVKLERIEPAGRIKKPRIVESHGKAPEQYPQWE